MTKYSITQMSNGVNDNFSYAPAGKIELFR